MKGTRSNHQITNENPGRDRPHKSGAHTFGHCFVLVTTQFAVSGHQAGGRRKVGICNWTPQRRSAPQRTQHSKTAHTRVVLDLLRPLVNCADAAVPKIRCQRARTIQGTNRKTGNIPRAQTPANLPPYATMHTHTNPRTHTHTHTHTHTPTRAHTHRHTRARAQ